MTIISSWWYYSIPGENALQCVDGEDAHADRVRRVFTKRDRDRRSQGCPAAACIHDVHNR